MVTAAAVTIVALGAWVGFELWTIRSALDDAKTQVSDLDLDHVATAGGLRPSVEPILDNISRAESHADSPVLSLLSPIPVIGDQIDGVRDVTAALDGLVTVGSQAIDDIDAAIANTGAPGGKVALIDVADDAVVSLTAAIGDIGVLDDDGLLPPLSGQIDELNRKLVETQVDLSDVRDDLATVRDVLVGPTRFLVVAANNAEMRAGMGMHLSAGVVTITDGEFETTDFYPTRELTNTTTGDATVPADLEEIFRGIWGFGHEWRTTSTTPNFPVVGDVLAQLSALSPFGPVDGVVSIDAPALSYLLEATGPVDVEDLSITSENAVDELLKENYIRLGERGQRDTRYELQSEVATSIFDAVTKRPIDMVTFASALQKAADGRNLLAWSGDEKIQELWEMLGADGALTADDLLVSFQNASASKRDYYIHPEVHLERLPAPDEDHTRVRVVAELTNPSVDPEPWYVETLSRWVDSDVHRTYVSFTLPGDATDISIAGGYSPRIGSDGPTRFAVVWMRVPVDETGTVTAEFTVPNEQVAVRLVPSARVVPTVYHMDGLDIPDTVYAYIGLPGAESGAAISAGLAILATVLVAMAWVLTIAVRKRLTSNGSDTGPVLTNEQLARVMTGLAAVIIGWLLIRLVS